MDAGPDPITSWLLRLDSEPKDERAWDALLGAVYDQLHSLARARMRDERRDHTLEPTALVNEAYLRLAADARNSWKNRRHFFGAAARAMEQVLIDHARRRRARKRGGGGRRRSLDDPEVRRKLAEPGAVNGSMEDVKAALDQLAACEKIRGERKARSVRLHFLAGLTYPEIAELLEVSADTVRRDIDFASAWLRQRLGR